MTAAGVSLISLGFFTASFATSSTLGFAAAFCPLVGTGVGLIYVPAITAVQRWFVTGRSRASGLALAGTGLGTFVGPSAATLLLETHSIETTMKIFAIAIAIVDLPAASYLVGKPDNMSFDRRTLPSRGIGLTWPLPRH